MIKYYKAITSIYLRRIVCLITSLIWQGVSSGQQLQLFEETETSSRAEEIATPSGARRDSEGNIISGPEFVLVGTTRIGGDFFVVLEGNTKELISISLTEGSSRSISGYPGYEVTYVGSGGEVSYQVSWGPPVYRVCGTRSHLYINKRSKPQPDKRAAAEPRRIRPKHRTSNGGWELLNPFEAILQRSSSPDSDPGVSSTFSPRRIDPSDVPPGMRVVSTPFGDRLVEEDE